MLRMEGRFCDCREGRPVLLSCCDFVELAACIRVVLGCARMHGGFSTQVMLDTR
jgi:hypothetical protein